MGSLHKEVDISNWPRGDKGGRKEEGDSDNLSYFVHVNFLHIL